MKEKNLKTYRAKIIWQDENKIVSICNSNVKYAPIILIQDIDIYAPWSCIVRVIEVLSATVTLSEISFLSSQAPYDMMSPGVRFSLFEGNKLVANGEVVSIGDLK